MHASKDFCICELHEAIWKYVELVPRVKIPTVFFLDPISLQRTVPSLKEFITLVDENFIQINDTRFLIINDKKRNNFRKETDIQYYSLVLSFELVFCIVAETELTILCILFHIL